jgi:hypothetical protein
LDGVVQIESAEILEKTALSVARDRLGEISVKLANGRPLQVEFNESELIDGQIASKRHQLFEEPIYELRFFKTNSLIHGEPAWAAKGENLVVTDMNRLHSLATIIGEYAKRERRTRMARMGIYTTVVRKPLSDRL